MDQFFSMNPAVAKEVGVIIRASAVSNKSLAAAIASLERMNARANVAPFAADLFSCDQTAFQTFLDARCGPPRA